MKGPVSVNENGNWNGNVKVNVKCYVNVKVIVMVNVNCKCTCKCKCKCNYKHTWHAVNWWIFRCGTLLSKISMKIMKTVKIILICPCSYGRISRPTYPVNE